MKKLIYFLASLLVLAVLGSVFFLYVLPRMVKDTLIPNFEPKEIIQVHTIVLKEVHELQKMEIIKQEYQDRVDYKFITGNIEPTISMDAVGEVVACIDFAKVDSNDIEVIGDTLILILPNPEICYAKINHEKTIVTKTSLTRVYNLFSNSKVVFENAYKFAENKMLTQSLESGILDSAKLGAQDNLVPLLSNLTQKDVFIKFPPRKQPMKPEAVDLPKIPELQKPNSIRD